MLRTDRHGTAGDRRGSASNGSVSRWSPVWHSPSMIDPSRSVFYFLVQFPGCKTFINKNQSNLDIILSFWSYVTLKRKIIPSYLHTHTYPNNVSLIGKCINVLFSHAWNRRCTPCNGQCEALLCGGGMSEQLPCTTQSELRWRTGVVSSADWGHSLPYKDTHAYTHTLPFIHTPNTIYQGYSVSSWNIAHEISGQWLPVRALRSGTDITI